MHIGKSYTPREFLFWTRRKVYILTANAVLMAALYHIAGWHWLALPWPVVAVLGTATSFIVGFKNAQTYSRTVEAQQIWSTITALSRYWALISRDFPGSDDATSALINRHLAWLTAVRYQLRSPRIWEAATHGHNVEYRNKTFHVPEEAVGLEHALTNYLPAETLTAVAATSSVPIELISLQSRAIHDLFVRQEISLVHHTEMQKILKDLGDQHARAERIKNFPYPRQYEIINSIFVWTFVLLLPMGVVREFSQLSAPEFLRGQMGWLSVPFSVLVAWMYIALDQVGESTSNPFEGSANDVPITHICRSI